MLVNHCEPHRTQAQVADLGGDMLGSPGRFRWPQPVPLNEARLPDARVECVAHVNRVSTATPG